MYRNISLAYQSLDTNGYILDVNPSWLKVLGYKEADVLGTRFRDYLHPDHVLMFERNFETLKQNGSSQDLVVKLRKQNGSYIFAAFEGVIEYDSHRKPIRTHSVFKDITIQKTLEQELSSQSERLKMAIEASQTGIWDWNFKEKRIYLDNRSYNMAGYVESDFQNFLSEFRKRIHPEELTKVQNEILKHLKGRSKTFDVEYRILKKNGAWMWISTHGKVTSRDSNGKPLRLSGTNTDIDFRKISELKIRESEQNLFDLVENMQDGVAIANENGHHIYVNKAFCKMTGYTQKELLNITGWELTLEKDIPILKERMSKRMQGQPIQSKYDRTIKRKDGATIKVEMSTTMTIWKGKKCPMVIVHDITEREETLNKIQFLVSLLRSVREINHRIVTETNFNDLIKSTCDILLQNQDYLYVEISLSSDDTDTITPYVSSGIMALCNWKHSRTNSSAPKCIREGVKLNKTIAVVDPEKYCINCQYYDADLPHETIVTPISRKNRIIGFIKTSLKSEHNITDEEIALLEEIAGDLAFAEEKFKSDLLLIESENRFKTMINRLVDAVFITDFDSNIIQANPAAVEQTGYTLDELKGIKMLQTLSPGYSDERKENIINSLKNNETVYFEEKKIRKNGDEYWTECTLNLINLKGKDLVLSVNREITEKKKTEDRLRQLSYVVEQNPASIVITDLNGTIEYINPKFTDLTGYFPEEAIGENPRVVKSGKMDQSIYKELWETITNGETWKGELLNRKKNGELFWELASISPLKNEADEITHYVGVKEDITKRKKHENTQKILLEISQSYNIQNTLFSFIKDVHQKIKEVVRADNFYVALYNSDDNTFSFPYHVDEFDQLELDKPYDFSNGYTDFVFKSNQSLSVTPDYQLEVEKDGTINGYGDEFSVWLGVPLKPDKKSKPIGVIAIQDYKNLEPYSEIDQALMEIISYHIVGFIERIKYLQELVRAKEKAEESEAQMNESQRVARIGYYSFNIKEGTWKSSDMLDEIFGIDDNYNRDVNGWLNLIHPDFKEIMQDYLHKEVITGRNRFDKQYKIINQKTQSEQWVHGLGNLGFNNQGEAITMFGTIQDISNIKQYEDELIHAKERAEESDKLKSAFLANMSHEIRTPMNGILGFLELLQDLNLSKEERDTYFDIVNKSGKRLMDTVNDIIEMSIIESGQIQITPKQVQVANLLSDFSDFFSLQAKEKGVKLILKIPKKSQKLVITTDESKLGIIISNLLRNAIKFTDKGQIDFGIKEEDDIVFYVKDTGRGIPQESLESIFDRFVQADNSLTRNYEGSGLGLSICQGYVKLLGGKIWVESTINKGSSFYFTLPYSFAFYNKNLIQSSSLKI